MTQEHTQYIQGSEHEGIHALQEAPVTFYDDCHEERFAERVRKNTLDDYTLRVLSSVNGSPVPFRWLGAIADTAQTYESIIASGQKPPKTMSLMSPVHASTTINGGTEDDIQKGIEQAHRLTQLAQTFINTFHPNILDHGIQIGLGLDDPESGIVALEHGTRIAEQIPYDVYESLMAMGRKHSNGIYDVEQTIGAYLYAHFGSYGDPNSLYLVPQSERRFVDFMAQTREAMTTLGHTPPTFADGNSVVLVSDTRRTPHYYAHKEEPLLSDLHSIQQWPTARKVNKISGLNGHAREEISSVVQTVETSIKGSHTITDARKLLTEMICDIIPE